MELSDLKILYEVFECDRERIKDAIESIEQGYVMIEDISNDNYFQSGSIVYSNDDWVMNNDGDIFNRDESFYCEGIDDHVHSDDITRVYEGRNETFYSTQYVENCSEFSYYDGDYYDDSALDYHNLVWVEDTGEMASRDDVYYHEDDGYYSYPDEEYCRGYHNGSFSELNFDCKSKFRIGFEIEKEDQEVRNSIGIDDFEYETDNKWRKEKDGSLDNDSGFELISPTFEFDIDKIFEHIEGNEVLVNHINSEKSCSCGGHIHLSENGLNGEELFEKIKGYTPLFYALYYGRVNKSYCKGKNNRDLVKENEKYQAIKIHGNRVEFRIISAVPNVNTLKWRSKLLMMIVQNPTNDIMKAYYNVDTKFTKLLKQTYSDEKLLEVKERFIKYTREFENLEIKNNN
jgi:hypothetical protein